MFPAILAAISALKSSQDKRNQEEQDRYRAAAQGQVAQMPQQHGGLGDAAQLAGGIVGGNAGKTLSSVGGALGGQSGALGGAMSGLLHPEPEAGEKPGQPDQDQDEDDMFGGIGR